MKNKGLSPVVAIVALFALVVIAQTAATQQGFQAQPYQPYQPPTQPTIPWWQWLPTTTTTLPFGTTTSTTVPFTTTTTTMPFSYTWKCCVGRTTTCQQYWCTGGSTPMLSYRTKDECLANCWNIFITTTTVPVTTTTTWVTTTTTTFPPTTTTTLWEIIDPMDCMNWAMSLGYSEWIFPVPDLHTCEMEADIVCEEWYGTWSTRAQHVPHCCVFDCFVDEPIRGLR